MIAEDEKRQIAESMSRAFNMQTILHYTNILSGAAQDNLAIEDYFLQVRACNIDSYLRVLARRGKSKPVAKHRPMLVRASILSLADGAFTLSDLGHGNNGRGPDGDHRNHYTDRQRQRLLRERYRDMFFEPDLKTHGIKLISSTFSKNDPPKSPAGEQSRSYLDAVRRYAQTHYGGEARRRMALRSILRSAFPQFLEEVAEFRSECRAVFESIGRRSDRIDFLRAQLVDDPRLLDMFYSHITSILDLVWFRTLSSNEQYLYLTHASQTKYTRQDAEKARRILVDIYGQDSARHTLDIAGVAFMQIGRPSAAVLVYGECLEVSKTDMERGFALQNTASAHRMSRNFKLALTCMKNALKNFESTRDTHRICNAHQLIAESQWFLGFRTAAMNSFTKVERLGAEMPEGERWRSQYLLGMSFGRLGEVRRSRIHFTQALELIPEAETEWIININNLILHKRPVWTDGMLSVSLSQEIDACLKQSDEWMYGTPEAVRPDEYGKRDQGGGA